MISPESVGFCLCCGSATSEPSSVYKNGKNAVYGFSLSCPMTLKRNLQFCISTFILKWDFKGHGESGKLHV